MHSQSRDKNLLYPDTTRGEPKLDLHLKPDADKLNAGLEAVNDGDPALARSILQPFADGSASKSKYAQAMALGGLASVSYQQEEVGEAIQLLKQALAIGVIPNDTYFQMMYQLAQFQVVNEQYKDALGTLERWREGGRRETAESYGLEGSAYFRMQQYRKAIAALNKAKAMADDPKPSWDQMLAASYTKTGQTDKAVALAEQQLEGSPGDVATQRNAINLLINSGKYEQAIGMMEKAQANGLMQEATDYLNLAKLHLMVAQTAEDPRPQAEKCVAVLQSGLSQGVLKDGYDTNLLKGRAAYLAGDEETALAAYAEAAKHGTTGEADLQRGQILFNMANYPAARSAFKAALEKGVKQMGSTYVLLASTERSLDNKKGAIIAMRKAATYPETRAQAEKWLKDSGY